MAPCTRSNRAIVVSVKKEKFREGLFKYIDSAPKRHVIRRSASKRVITIDLFNHIQKHIDAYERARVSLVDLHDDGSMEVIVADTKPMSEQYDEILRRVRFN